MNIGRSIGVEDLKEYDYQIYQSLKFLNENKTMDFDTEDFKFSVMDQMGEEIDLIPNGKNIKVTQQRRQSYVKRVSRFYLVDSVRGSLRAFVRGFH